MTRPRRRVRFVLHAHRPRARLRCEDALLLLLCAFVLVALSTACGGADAPPGSTDAALEGVACPSGADVCRCDSECACFGDPPVLHFRYCAPVRCMCGASADGGDE